MLLLALVTMISLTSCAPRPSSLCGALSRFTPDAGFDQRWTAGEMRQAVAHNRKLDEFC